MGYTAALVAPTMPSRPPACAVNGTTAFVFANQTSHNPVQKSSDIFSLPNVPCKSAPRTSLYLGHDRRFSSIPA